MHRFIANMFTTKTDRSGNRYAVVSIESAITHRQIWVKCPAGSHLSQIMEAISAATGCRRVDMTGMEHTITKKQYGELSANATPLRYEKLVRAEIRGLERNMLFTCNFSERQDVKCLEDAIEAMGRLNQRFRGPLADLIGQCQRLVKEAIEEEGSYVVSANGTNRMRLYSATGKVGKEVAARRAALKREALSRMD